MAMATIMSKYDEDREKRVTEREREKARNIDVASFKCSLLIATDTQQQLQINVDIEKDIDTCCSYKTSLIWL